MRFEAKFGTMARVSLQSHYSLTGLGYSVNFVPGNVGYSVRFETVGLRDTVIGCTIAGIMDERLIIVEVSAEERLGQLVGEYYDQAINGCVPAVLSMVTGKTGRIVGEIAELVDRDAGEINQLFASVNMLCVGAKDHEEAYDRLHEAFMKGTHGGQGTGDPSVDETIERYAILSRMMVDKNLELREKRRAKRQ